MKEMSKKRQLRNLLNFTKDLKKNIEKDIKEIRQELKNEYKGIKAKEHVCSTIKYCKCFSGALEPNEDCPIHGFPLYNKCKYCGRFMKND